MGARYPPSDCVWGKEGGGGRGSLGRSPTNEVGIGHEGEKGKMKKLVLPPTGKKSFSPSPSFFPPPKKESEINPFLTPSLLGPELHLSLNLFFLGALKNP